MDNAALAVIWYLIFVISTTCHEAAHGLAAKMLGDKTAYHHGLVTLDPVPHIKRSPFGMVIVPFLSFALNGWMLGWASAPYDPFWAQQNRKKSAMMSLAGPAANLSLVIIAALVIRIAMLLGVFQAPPEILFGKVTKAASEGFANSAAIVISILFTLNLILFTFNLIPLPPLDGSNILLFFLKDKTARRYEDLLHNQAYMIIGLIIAWQIFGPVFSVIHLAAINILYPGAGYH